MDYSYFAASQQYPFVGLPSKPEHPYTPQEDLAHDPIDTYNDHNTYHHFDPSYQFAQNHHMIHSQSPPPSLHRPSITKALQRDSSNSNEMPGDYDTYEQAQGRSSDEDKDNLTPAQARRKAQNRAAQRAFRERKERHVKDLEVKLTDLEAHSSTLLTDNERLKRELETLATQNEVLRATTGSYSYSHHNSHTHTPHLPPPPESPIPGPQTYSPSAFHEALISTHSSYVDKPISHRIQVSATTGERLLATGATWDFIQSHELYRKGMVDIGEVCDRLKDRALCDGSGPAFAEGEIMRAIEDSVGGAGDELI